MNPEDFDEHGSSKDQTIVSDLFQLIRSARTAFNVPIGDSRRCGDRDYMEEVGRMTIERLWETYPECGL